MSFKADRDKSRCQVTDQGNNCFTGRRNLEEVYLDQLNLDNKEIIIMKDRYKEATYMSMTTSEPA